jgi:O-antigen ligase
MNFKLGMRPTVSTGLLSVSYKALARLLILASVPASLFWYPILEVPNFGRITASEISLMALWVLTLVYYATLKKRSGARDQAFLILILATILGVLAALGSIAFSGAVGPVKELSLHMKRFGLAAVLPLALNCFASRRLYRWSPIVLLACILMMDLFSIFPNLQAGLMITSLKIDSPVLSERAAGMLSNPNDSAYIAICALASVIAMALAREKRRCWTNLLIGSAISGALATIVLSASRSGVLGFLAGSFFYIMMSRSSLIKKSLLIVLLALSAGVGLHYSDVFGRRMESALTYRLREVNVESRLQAQYVALRAAIENPLGVGFSNMPQATGRLSYGMAFFAIEESDSVYFDTILSAGFLGLAVLLLLYRTCWRYVGTSLPHPIESLLILKAGCVAVFVFGLASISPASIFVAPVAFFMVGSCALPRMGNPLVISSRKRNP